MSHNRKLIYLIRHGETAYNKLGVVQGSGIDADLNETGLAQADSFYEFYKNIPFQKIYVSALKRTFQTVKRFVDSGVKYESLVGLNEISWGEKEGKIPNASDDDIYSTLLCRWAAGELDLAPLGGESPLQVVERQKVALEIILSNREEELILVAMHGRAMRILLTHLMGLPLHQMDVFEHSNTCLYTLEYSYISNQFSILSANDTRHLIEQKMETLI